MKRKKLIVSIGNLQSITKEVIDVCRQLEMGKKIQDAPIEKITFANENILFRLLSKGRRDLLKYVHEYGKMTIRSLANELRREYEDVQRDVKLLFNAGFMLKDKKSAKYYVPWDSIVTEIPLKFDESIAHHYHSHGSHAYAG